MSSEFSHWMRGTPLITCWSHWQSIRGGRTVPWRRDLDPADIPPAIVANLFLYRREADRRLRCRVFGSALATMFQHDATGHYLDELLPPDKQAQRTNLFHEVLDQGRPALYCGRLVEGERSWVSFRRLLLPVASEAEPDFVFGMVIFPTATAVPQTQVDDESVDLQMFATDADLAFDAGTNGGRAGQV